LGAMLLAPPSARRRAEAGGGKFLPARNRKGLRGLVARKTRAFWGNWKVRGRLGYSTRNLTKVAETGRRKSRATRSKQRSMGLQSPIILTDSYSIANLQELFGLSARRVRGWIARGLLVSTNGQFAAVDVLSFIRQHPREYDLSRVDKTWFKSMIFDLPGATACL
jgi:hypothetical protein